MGSTMKIGDLVEVGARVWLPSARRLGFITDRDEADGGGCFVLFTNGQEFWFDDDEFTVVATTHTQERIR